MIDPEVFRERSAVCKKCSFFDNICLKGHIQTSPTGCPVRKFQPVNHAAWDPDMEVVRQKTSGACCGGEIKPIQWSDVLQEFTRHMARWAVAEFPVVSGAVHKARYAVCNGCPHYKWYQCQICRCIVYVKTKLATERCPDNPSRWS